MPLHASFALTAGAASALRTAGSSIAVVALLVFHLHIIGRGQTTYENIERAGSTYSDGCARNCYAAWCEKIPDPYVDFSMPIELAERREPPDIVKMCNPPWADECPGAPRQELAVPTAGWR